MKELETIEEYLNKLLGITNNIKLLDKEFLHTILVGKILVMVLQRYETLINSLKNTKDLSIITLTSDTCLASTRTTNINERRSCG